MDKDQRTVSADGVTVTKRLDTNRFNTPAVTLEITSTADRSTSITVTEPIPDSFAIENVGFHPEYGSEHWSISEDRIVFNRAIEPDDEYTTVYGVRNVTDDELETFLDGETVVSTSDGVDVTFEDDAVTDGDDELDVGDDADGDDPVEELLLEGKDETVRGLIAGEDDSLTETGEEDQDTVEFEDEDPAEATESEAKEDLDEPAAEETAEDTEEEPGAEDTGEDIEDGLDAEETPEGTGDEAPGEFTGEYQELPDSVAEALAREVRNGSISDENERVLREAFSDTDKTRRDVDLRIKQLQTQVADIAAYTDEFERFLDAYGTGDNAFDSLEESLTDVAHRVKELEDSLGAVNQQAAEIESKLEATRDELDARSEHVDTLDNRVTNVETDLNDVLYLEEEVMELEDQSETLSDLEETVETLDTEMERMKRFRDRLSSAFGPDGDGIEE